ncbi:PQQ-like beta-propeller repeat protein [Saccharothrix sp. NEAU-S10]|nr:PQQ-like beta-propeller repeat protein [Saccharothrix luteola]
MLGIRWERPLHQAGSGADVAVGSGGLVVHERNTRLVCLDPEDGSVRWDVRTGRWLRAMSVAGQRVLVLWQDDELTCLDLATGEDVWRVVLRRWTGHLVVDGDVVLVGGWRGYTPLRALDIATGRTLWEAEHDVRTVWPAAGGGGFLIGEPGGSEVRLIGRRDGRRLRTCSLPQPLAHYDHEVAFTAVGGDRFLVRCGDDAVARISLSAGTASELVVAGSPLVPVAPQHVGGLLWLRERGTGFTVADPHDGRVVWRTAVRQAAFGEVIAEDGGSGGGFVLADAGGSLLFVDSRGQVVERVKITQRVRELRRLAPGRVLVLTKGTLLAAAFDDDAHPDDRS